MSIDIRKPIKKFLPHLLEARDQNLSEADTMMRIIKVLEEALGYDAMREITREQAVKDRYVDLALKIDGVIQLLIEVKAANVQLRDKQIEQAQNYASNGNIQWVLLTNGINWSLYHLTFDEGIQFDKVFEVSIADIGDAFNAACDAISILHRKSVSSNGLTLFWEKSVALSPSSIAKALFSEDTINVIRRELKRIAAIRVDEEAVVSAIHKMFSIETRELIGPPRIRRKRKQKTDKTAVSSTGSASQAVEHKKIEIIGSIIENAKEE